MTAGERPDNRVVLWLSLVDEEESSWEVGLVERKSGVRLDWASYSRFSLVGGGKRVRGCLRSCTCWSIITWFRTCFKFPHCLCFNGFPLAFERDHLLLTICMYYKPPSGFIAIRLVLSFDLLFSPSTYSSQDAQNSTTLHWSCTWFGKQTKDSARSVPLVCDQKFAQSASGVRLGTRLHVWGRT